MRRYVQSFGAARRLLSVAAIRSPALMFNATAILRIRASVGMCSPRSIFPMWERSTSARDASSSCAMPCSKRAVRTASPKATAGADS